MQQYQIIILKHNDSDEESINIGLKINLSAEMICKSNMILSIFEKCRSKQSDNGLIFLHKCDLVPPYQENIFVDGLESGKLYKFLFEINFNQRQSVQSIFAATKLSQSNQGNQISYKSFQKGKMMCRSEKQIMSAVEAGNGQIQLFQTPNDIRKEILAARKNKDSRDFILNGYKYSNHNKESRKKRVWMIGQSLQIMDEINDLNNPGQMLLENNWFMGPFYSHDQNYEQMKKLFN